MGLRRQKVSSRMYGSIYPYIQKVQCMFIKVHSYLHSRAQELKKVDKFGTTITAVT